MKKMIYFLPAFIFTTLYGIILLIGGSINPIVWLWVAVLWIAGILLSKSLFWGAFFGFIPCVCFIYMGTQDTGQIIKETWTGILLIIYYLVCMAYCIYKKK